MRISSTASHRRISGASERRPSQPAADGTPPLLVDARRILAEIRDSRASLRHLANLWERWSTLTDCVRTGARVAGPQRSDDPAWTAAFIGAMHRGSGLRAPGLVKALADAGLLAGRSRVLDVGGGSGTYCHALLAALPAARATLFDLPAVGIRLLAGDELLGDKTIQRTRGCGARNSQRFCQLALENSWTAQDRTQ